MPERKRSEEPTVVRCIFPTAAATVADSGLLFLLLLCRGKCCSRTITFFFSLSIHFPARTASPAAGAFERPNVCYILLLLNMLAPAVVAAFAVLLQVTLRAAFCWANKTFAFCIPYFVYCILLLFKLKMI